MNRLGFDFDSTGQETARYTMRCWGDFQLIAPDGRDMTPRGRKARALLAWLALHPDRPVSRERLCGLLWGDRGEEQARSSLRQTLFELKPFSSDQPLLLVVDRVSVLLVPTHLQTDFSAIAAAQGTIEPWRHVLPDHGENFLANLDDIDPGFDDWLAIERTRQRDRLEALLARWDAAPVAPVPPAPSDAAPTNPSLPIAPAPEAPLQASPNMQTTRPRALILLLLVIATAIAAIAAWRILRESPQAAPLTIAVLPFEDLSGSDRPYFAEGISVEILNQLARNPALKVLGRTSAASLRDAQLDPVVIGRRLDVDYLVEGSVRASGPSFRVTVALVRTDDGTRLWSEHYDGTVQDVFSIQDRIGQAVSKRLNLGKGIRPEAALKAEGEAYSLYMQASGMLRSKEPSQIEPAIAQLRKAIAQDPDYAPAWAAFGQGLVMRSLFGSYDDQGAAERKAANAAARRALQLQPDLALGHMVLALASSSQAEATPHLEEAVRLDPMNAEIWNELTAVYEHEGDYPRVLQATRKAVAIDPLWWPAFYFAAEWAWAMGYPDEAEAYVRRVEAGGIPLPFQAHMVRGDMASRRGDYSGQLEEGQGAWLASNSSNRFFAELTITHAFRAVGRYDEAAQAWRHYPFDAMMNEMWKGNAPSQATVGAMISDPGATWKSPSRIHFLLSTLLSAGRTEEVARLYDAQFASPDAMQAYCGTNAAFLWNAALVARSLRATGRAADADRLLALADSAAVRIEAHGRAPHFYHAARSVQLAASGRPDEALKALETAVARGWNYESSFSFADIGQDPAFSPIRKESRFQKIRASINANIARESRELTAVPLDPRVAAQFLSTATTN